MGKFKKILVPIDGSEASKNALLQSFKLAASEENIITVLAVDPVYQGDLELVTVSNIKDVLKGPGKENLDEAQKIADDQKVPITTRLENGDPVRKILEVAEEEKCDLIVMGRRGMTRFERALMGSVTSKIIASFHGMTLVVMRDSTLDWSNMLLATDGTKASDAAVESAIDFALTYQGTLNILSVVPLYLEYIGNHPDVVQRMVRDARVQVDRVRDHAREKGVNAESFVREGEPYERIVELATELKTNMIVTGSHGRQGLTRVFLGSVASMVIGHSSCPVMVVNK